MVSLIDIYNIKESTFEKLEELKSSRNPARGNKAKNREKDFELVSGEPDPETGRISSKVVRKLSLSNMFNDLYAEAQDFEKLTKEEKYQNDTALYNISEELKELIKVFRKHLRDNYPDEHRKIEEANVTGTGTSISTGDSPAFATPFAFGDNKKKKLKTYKSIGYKEINEQEQEDERFNQSTKTISGLADLFLNYSRRLRKGEFKGIQSGEIDEIDDLLAMVLTAAEETNITAIIQRLENMLEPRLKDY